MKRDRSFLYHGTFLISRVIQHERKWKIDMQSRKVSEEGTHTLCINIRIIRHGDDFMRDRIERSKDVKAFSP